MLLSVFLVLVLADAQLALVVFVYFLTLFDEEEHNPPHSHSGYDLECMSRRNKIGGDDHEDKS